ncbi:MAG: prephenate dehydratase [Bacteroidales bacterium]|nr:prephenate dehydratase [Bacteroidales bacterium]
MIRVAIQGEKGCFHEVAAQQYFEGSEFEVVACPTFDSEIDAVLSGRADNAFMAIENARTGTILYNYSLLRESGLKIIGEHNLRVQQNLMALPGQGIDNIREIWSHPVALSQCQAFLNGFPHIKLIEKDDTAGSARYISEHSLMGVAAIGPELAARLYGLEILKSGVETNKLNYTRFMVLSKELAPAEGMNMASLCFSLPHQPGSLASLLVLLARHNVSLTKIQSVPRIIKEWEYLFYLDLEFSEGSSIDQIISLVEDHTSDFELLGIYRKRNLIHESVVTTAL